MVSGLPTDQFLFVGFLPRRRPEDALRALASIRATLILYKAPHRLEQTLRLMHEVLGNRPLALCRELTKLYEEVWRGDLGDVLQWVSDHPPRGEYTLVVAGATEDHTVWDEDRVRALLLMHALAIALTAAASRFSRRWERRRYTTWAPSGGLGTLFGSYR